LRESLTVLAGILILILSAALIVPNFINWSAQRRLVETQLSEVLGRPVQIRGAIDLKLLPTPYLRLADVELGSPAAAPQIKVQEIRLEIALTALLRGEVDFVEAKLVRPQLALAIQDGILPLGPGLQRFSGPMRFERISVEDGALNLADPATGRIYAFENISFGAEAVSLAGPFKAEGRFVLGGQTSSFRLATGDRIGDHLHVKLIVDENTQHPRGDLDADLTFAKTNADFSLPSVAGQIKLSGHLTGEITLPWQLTGRLKAELRKAAIDDLDLRLGDDDRGLNFNGSADVDFGTAPHANATLKAAQMDLDRLLGGPGAVPAMQRLAQALTGLAKSDDPLVFGMPLTLEGSADTAVLGGETLSDLSARLSSAAKGALSLRFETSGPGRSHLRLEGDGETASAAAFKGHIEANAGDAVRFNRWLSANLPQSAPLVAAMPVKSFDVSGDINLSVVGFVLQNLSLKLDQSVLSGTLAYTQSVGGEPARLFADLSATRLDLDGVPDLASLADRAKALDLSLHFDAGAVKINSLGPAGLDTGRLQLRFEKAGQSVRLDQLVVSGLGGTDIHANGQWDGTTGTFTGTIDAEKLEAAVALVQRLAPGPLAIMLAARATDLAPAHLNVVVHGIAGSLGAIRLASLDLVGTAGGTKIKSKIATDPQMPADLILSAQIDAPDALVLIRQLGLQALPVPGFGAGQINIDARGSLDKVFATKLTASLAGANVAFQGDVRPDLGAPQAIGKVQLASAGLTSLLEATGLAFPDPSLPLAADLKADIDARPGNVLLQNLSGRFAGTGLLGHLTYDLANNRLTGALDTDRLALASLIEMVFGPLPQPQAGALWSNAKFTAAMFDPPPIDLAMSAKSFDLWPQISGRDAQFGLEISGGRSGLKLMLHHASMKLGAGTLAAEFTLRRDGANGAAAAHLTLADYDLSLPSLRGKLGANLDISGTGDSAAAVISGLVGTGTLSFTDLIVPRADPGAMLRVFKAVEDEVLPLDVNAINRALATELDKGISRLRNETFDARLAAGFLRLMPKATEVKRLEPGVTETLQASLDLGHLILEQRAHLSLVALPKNWSGPEPQIDVISTGPLTDPVRTIDSANFLNALAARVIARESERIQTQEFDVHEQGFFYNRLKSERRRAQERLTAAEEAKRAAAAKEEAAKAERANAEADKAEATAPISAPATATPMPVVRPAFPPAKKTPMSIEKRPAQVPAPTPGASSTSPTDPLAAGRF
jgi:hypothetical protein